MATISFQNLFRLYDKLAGMTGTAATEAEEFFKIYKLDVVEIPTNKEIVRKDFPDRIYKDTNAKYNAIVAEIKEKQELGQPVLVGTVSVEKNEVLSRLMKKAGIKHEVLNAKNHAREAKIIMKAGLKCSVTVATNMAGRGTDIKLDPEVRKLGGLHVLGTERHEARRIDNQLRGRAGRQGDPGSSTFYVSMDDDLMRIFGGERMKKLMDSLGLPDDVPIENKMISRSIESAQRRVEGHNFDIRKHLVEYDDVMNKHREVIYRKRRRILESATDEKAAAEIREEILGIIKDEAEAIARVDAGDHSAQVKEIQSLLNSTSLAIDDFSKLEETIEALYGERERQFGSEVARNVERAVYLRTIDMLWVEHLTTMDELRTGIGLRGYGQRDPLVEYKQEAYNMFQNLLRNIEASVAKTIFRVNVQVSAQAPRPKPLEYQAPDPDQVGNMDNELADMEPKNGPGPVSDSSAGVTTVIRQNGKTVYDRMNHTGSGERAQAKSSKSVGRNDPCPCGSGKKYKKCCGR